MREQANRRRVPKGFRDDLGTAVQLGWTPPSPLYMVRMLLATRRARREAGR